MSCQWLLTIAFLSHLSVIGQCDLERRHLFIGPGNDPSQERCPTDHCYSLQEVIKNQSYFFDSNTTLELMPGRYDIIEKVGQLVIANVSHFILKGSQINLTVIYCQQYATFGFIFANTDDIVISDIQISHCCAQLSANITIDATRADNYTITSTNFKPEINTSIRRWLDAYQGPCNAQNRFPCCTTIATIDSGKISIHQTTVLHSKGVGILILRYASLNISGSILAYSRINCIIYISNNLGNTTTTLSNNQILFGRKHSFNLASGINIMLVSISLISNINRFDSINAKNNTFTSNSASKGNFYLLVYRGVECHNLASVKITITNTTIKSTIATSGITMEYFIFDSFPFYWLIKPRYSRWPQCIQPGTSEEYTPVTYIIQNSYLEGSCVIVKNLLKIGNKYLNITLTGVRINKSLCPLALKLEHVDSFHSTAIEHSIYNGHVKKIINVEHYQIYVHNLVISLSRKNIIMLFTAPEDEAHTIWFLGNTSFTENQGSIIVVGANITLQGNVRISNNHAYDHDSVLLIRDRSAVSFQGDIAFINNRGRQGGALSAYNSDITFQGDITFINNRGRQGGALSAYNSDITFQGDITFINNRGRQGGALFVYSSEIRFQGDIAFTNNSGRQGGALSAYSSKTEFQGRVRFIGNIAETVGGGISLREGSTIFLETVTNLSFYTNAAMEYGGGIFVEETMLWESNMTLQCFAQTFNVNNTIVFDNNNAELAGMGLFGGWIDICNPRRYAVRPIIYTFKNHGQHHMDEYSDISSNAARVCICENSRPTCNITSVSIKIIPGRSFEIEAVAVGQRFGVVPAIVKAEFQNQDGNGNIVNELQRSQDVGTYCTTLTYTVHSRNNNETMQLVIDRQQVPKPDPSLEIDILQFQQLEVIIHLKNCPLGFIFDSIRNICMCHYSLEKQGIHCNTSSQTVIRKAQKWISTIHVHIDGIAVNHHCPYDYCKSHDLSLNLSTPDDQCAFSRSGILCGSCQPGKSQVLGTSNCKKCSDAWLLLLLPFGLAGVALIVCLMVLNITVSTGTINGLIFYANIVRANTAIFFPGQSANTFLSWFIAWLSLDLGIETCFYDGLTGYAKTWLQYLFPIYIWILVLVIIISSYYSTRAARICGNNAVQVLATLFFLSYAKLLRVTIAVFQPTQLLILGDSLSRIKVVWNYDGNLDYLSGQHIPLFVFTLLFFIAFFIPYTLALFGIQWLQPISHHKPLFWVNRLKPLFDAYTGPYKDKHRYWTGLLLLMRIVLFCIFSANTTGDPAINLLVIIIVIDCLFVYLGLLGGVYKYWPLNLLEYVFLLNLVVLSAGSLYTTAVEKSVHPVMHVSVSTALVITICIVLYHGIHIFVKKCHMKEKIWKLPRIISQKRSNTIDMDVQQCNFEEHPNVTYSIVEMETALLHQ